MPWQYHFSTKGPDGSCGATRTHAQEKAVEAGVGCQQEMAEATAADTEAQGEAEAGVRTACFLGPL